MVFWRHKACQHRLTPCAARRRFLLGRTAAVEYAVDTPSTFVSLAPRFDGLEIERKSARAFDYGQGQEIRLSIREQEGRRQRGDEGAVGRQRRQPGRND